MNDWWLILYFAGVAVLVTFLLVGRFQEQRHRTVIAAARKVHWERMVKARKGNVQDAAIDYRAFYGAWPGDWNLVNKHHGPVRA